jgi:hypothetical protein
MAKVEIEDRGFNEPRLKTAAARFKVSRAVIIGYAAFLWRESQQAGVIEASKDEILAWLGVDLFAKPERALEWLVAADMLRPIESGSTGDRFFIAGNQIAVPRAQRRIASAQNAVRERERKRSHIEPIIDPSSDRSSDRSSVDHPDRKTGLQDDIGTTESVAPTYQFSDGDMRAAQWLQQQIVTSNPRAVKAPKANLKSWANEIRLMQSSDGIDIAEIAEVLRWVFEVDDFWRGVVQSPVALRRSWDKITAKMGAAELKARRELRRSSAWDIPEDRANVGPYKPRPGDIVAE